MKRTVMNFKIEQPKHRAHKALFDADLPFKPKVEKQKKGQYNRRPKHRKDSWED